MTFSSEARRCCNAAGDIGSVKAAELASPLRGSPAVASARQIAIWLFYEWRKPDSWTELGRAFGRDRTTVRHAVERVNARMIADEDGLGQKVREALSQLRKS